MAHVSCNDEHQASQMSVDMMLSQQSQPKSQSDSGKDETIAFSQPMQYRNSFMQDHSEPDTTSFSQPDAVADNSGSSHVRFR
jgi:hypothetical protein